MATGDLPGLVRDAKFPPADRLLSPYATDILTAAVAPEGGKVRQASVRLVDYYPGRNVYASYDAVVEWPNRASQEVLGVVARYDSRTQGERVVDIDGIRADVWRYPHDPYLPGLVDAVDGAFVEALLDELDLNRGAIGFDVRSYSPRNRAAVEVTSEPVSKKLVFRPGHGFAQPKRESILYLKILRPERARETYAAHAALEGVVPIASCVHADLDRGILAIKALPGAPLWDCIVDGVHRPLDADELLDVLERIKDVDLQQDSRMTATEACHLNMDTLKAVLPAQAGTLDRFRERLGEDAPQPEITVHGDFHEVQLLVDDDGLSGLLDLDDVGRGYRVDDMAMLLGRLWAYAQTEQRRGDRVAAYFWSLLETWERHIDPVELRRRIAAVNMNHALQPFRYQEHSWRARCAQGIARADALLTQLLPEARAS